MYTVKQVAEKMGISAYTLRFYDKEGLFPHVSRTENNVRLFSEQDLEWVHIEQEQAAMAKRIDTLRRKVEYYNALLEEEKEDTCNPMT